MTWRAISQTIRAPMTLRAIGVEPLYTHLLTRDQSVAYEDAVPVPAGATELLRVGAWHMYALPAPMLFRQIDPGGWEPGQRP